MTLLDFIVLTFIIYFAFILGWRGRENHAKREVDKLFASMEDQEDDSCVRIYIEKEQGFVFAYNYETDEFIAQGANKDALVKAMLDRFPKTKFIVEKDMIENI